MKIWLLDDGPLGLLARIFDPRWSWPAGALGVVREVADGATNDKSGRRASLLAMSAASGAPCITVHDGGPLAAGVLFGHLRPQAATAMRDLGEDASIAICATELPAAIFVTMDKRAAYIALAELGGARVAPPFELWDWLEHQGLITPAEYRMLCEITAKQDHGLSGVPLRFRR
jgi:hypothetical protein